MSQLMSSQTFCTFRSFSTKIAGHCGHLNISCELGQHTKSVKNTQPSIYACQRNHGGEVVSKDVKERDFVL